MSFKGQHAESVVSSAWVVSLCKVRGKYYPTVNASCRDPITQYTENKKQTPMFSHDSRENSTLPQDALTDGFARPCFSPDQLKQVLSFEPRRLSLFCLIITKTLPRSEADGEQGLL